MYMLMQTGLEAYATPAGVWIIVLVYVGKMGVAWVGKRKNGKPITSPSCWVNEHEQMIRDLVKDTHAALMILSASSDGGTPLVYREPNVAQAVDGVDKRLNELHITLLKMCNRLDLMKQG